MRNVRHGCAVYSCMHDTIQTILTSGQKENGLLIHAFFLYKNNFIRTRLKFAQKLRIS